MIYDTKTWEYPYLYNLIDQYRDCLLYTSTVMAFTVFFQYRAYTKNYNATGAKLCALIHEKYPDVSDGSIAAILNDSSFDSD